MATDTLVYGSYPVSVKPEDVCLTDDGTYPVFIENTVTAWVPMEVYDKTSQSLVTLHSCVCIPRLHVAQIIFSSSQD